MSGHKVVIGIVGGSGLDDPSLFKNRQEKFVDTPFGKPSDALIIGEIEGVDCVLLARHGRKHDVMPTNINFRANIWALKDAGCTHVLVTTACGSLQEDIKPGQIVFLDQFVDRTTKRAQTFHDGGENSPAGVCHIQMAQPFCDRLRKILIKSAKSLDLDFHESGTNVTVEGPRFSSKAESKIFQSWGCQVVNMTTVPEVVLARELGLSYAAMALVTDYDCWREEEGAEHVSVEAVLEIMKENAMHAKQLILDVIPKIAQEDWTETLAGYKAGKEMSVM